MVAPPTLHSDSYNTGMLERLLFRVARRWVAGSNLNDAIHSALNSNTRGIDAIVNFLGEDTVDSKAIDSTLHEYFSLMDRLRKEGIRGCTSIKPTQIGLSLDYDECLEQYKSIATRAKELGQFIWIDMESAKFAESTISIYLDIIKEFGGIAGIALQSYLRRSASDLMHILEHGGIVRLVKGAYHESEDLAFTSRQEIDSNYSKLMRMLFDSENRFAIATHDSSLIDEAIRLAAHNNNQSLTPQNLRFEFQMLMGIRDELKSVLVSKGFRVSEYIPYGSHWLPYSIRRLREHKRNILLLARSLI